MFFHVDPLEIETSIELFVLEYHLKNGAFTLFDENEYGCVV